MYPQKSTKIKTQLTTKIRSFDIKNVLNKNNEIKKLSYKNLMKIPSNRIYIPHSISSSNLNSKKKKFLIKIKINKFLNLNKKNFFLLNF